ncbi:MAG TPA: hypothetical protein VM661_01670 [Candidatus Sulfotelmatobacter sp.]|jgi:hypothetical protein|nr:hypothetical protein [Candidatus Sulfotelmatobacter sp.]
MNRLLHILDGVAVLLGIAVLLAAVINNSPAEAATVLESVAGRHSQPIGVILGFTLTSLPLSRRAVYHAFMRPADMRELHDVGRALQRIALMQRVQAGNIYLAHMDDQGVRNVFSSDKGLWDWLSPAYRDESLRRQMHPKLLSRLDALAEEHGQA